MRRVDSDSIGVLARTAIAVLLTSASVAHAQLTITPGNLVRGFSVIDYAVGFPNSGSIPFGWGPVGIAFLPNQSVLVTDPYDHSIFSLPSHANNQAVGASLYSYGPGHGPGGLAQVEIGGVWHYYSSDGSDCVEIDPASGAIIQTVVPGAGGWGMAPFPPAVSGPLAGHIFICGGGSIAGTTIWDVDPVAMTAAPFVASHTALSAAQGISFSPDGTILYTAWIDTVRALSVPGGAQLWAFTHLGEGYSGIAVGVGNLDGYVYVSTYGGNLWELGTPWGTHAGVENLLATGTRGDLMAADPNISSGGSYPSLLVPQTDRISRLDPPGGGWFGPPTSSTALVSNVAAVPDVAGRLETGLVAITPNPAGGPTRIDFALERDMPVRLGVVDVQGREVALLIHGVSPAGRHAITWNGMSSDGPAPSGIYFVRFLASGQVFTKRVALTR